MNFWEQLPKPFFVLAPMEDVTDTVFRELIASTAVQGKLHVMFTEFTSVDGFLHDEGKERVRHRLFISEKEKETLVAKKIRLVAQIWGSDPEKFYRAAREISGTGLFDGIDINMGCPVKKIIKKSGCSALILNPDLAGEIIVATREGSDLPVSVKTRTGFHAAITEEWTGHLLEAGPDAITLHGRTQKMQSEGQADWNEIRKAVETRDAAGSGSRIIGNGDVSDFADGIKRSETSGADGIMVGRGIFKNPAFFTTSETLDEEQRIHMLKLHIRRFEEVWGGKKPYSVLKRFFKIYLHSMDNVSSVRGRMMDSSTPEEGLNIMKEFEAEMRVFS